MFSSFAFSQNAIVSTPSFFSEYYIGGGFTTYATNTNPYFRMLDSTGSISSSFNIGTGFNNSVRTAATQSDGQIVLGGDFTLYNGSSFGATRIVRLLANGLRDPGFNPGTGFNSNVISIAIQADQKIVAGGAFFAYSSAPRNYITRINTNGTLDASFNIGTGFSSHVNTIAVQADQKIVAGGLFTSYSGSTKSRITRINTDGTADTGSSWNQGIGFNSNTSALALQTDQKILVVGTFTTYSGSFANYITRINTNGTLDTSFNIGTGFNSQTFTLAIQSDQKIVIGGAFTTYSGSFTTNIARLNTNGTLDTSFNVGTGFDSNVQALAIQPDGKILVQGTFSNYSGSIDRKSVV
jgi:uncharacterized delta-60 repeat protein